MRNYSLYVKFNALIVGTIFICGLLIRTGNQSVYEHSHQQRHFAR